MSKKEAVFTTANKQNTFVMAEAVFETDPKTKHSKLVQDEVTITVLRGQEVTASAVLASLKLAAESGRWNGVGWVKRDPKTRKATFDGLDVEMVHEFLEKKRLEPGQRLMYLDDYIKLKNPDLASKRKELEQVREEQAAFEEQLAQAKSIESVREMLKARRG